MRGLGLDAEVECLLLKALEPDQVSLALAALEELEQEYASLKRQRELHLERLRYETMRAQRQYDAVEPENRLVARTLKKRWEGKLRKLEKAEREFQRWIGQQRLTLSPTDRKDILAVGASTSQRSGMRLALRQLTANESSGLSSKRSLWTKSVLAVRCGSK